MQFRKMLYGRISIPQPILPTYQQTKWKPNLLLIRAHMWIDPDLLHLDLSSWITQPSVRTSSFNTSFILKYVTTERHLSIQKLNSLHLSKTKLSPFLWVYQYCQTASLIFYLHWEDPWIFNRVNTFDCYYYSSEHESTHIKHDCYSSVLC